MIDLTTMSKREKTLLAVFVAVLLAYVFNATILSPFMSRWTELNTRIELAEHQVLKNSAILQRRDVIQRQYNQLKGIHKETEPAGDTDNSAWLGIIDKAAGDVYIKSVTPRTPESRSAYVAEAVEVECSGNLSSLVRFMYGLVHSPYLLRIDVLRLRSADDVSGGMNCYLVISKITMR